MRTRLPKQATASHLSSHATTSRMSSFSRTSASALMNVMCVERRTFQHNAPMPDFMTSRAEGGWRSRFMLEPGGSMYWDRILVPLFT